MVNEIDQGLIDKIPHFETFFARVGFKRTDGAVFGLLTFSTDSLRSEEIQSILGLSQPAVSNALKTLTQYSMIETRDHPENKRIKVHSPKENAISIVAGILRKREMEYLLDFEKVTTDALAEAQKLKDTNVINRLQTIVSTTKFAKSLTDFIVKVDEEFDNPYPVIDRIPGTLKFLKENYNQIQNKKNNITGIVGKKLNELLDTMEKRS